MIAKYTQCAPLHDDCYIRVYCNCASMMGRSLIATAACFLAMWHFLHGNSCMFKLCGIVCMANAGCLSCMTFIACMGTAACLNNSQQLLSNSRHLFMCMFM